MDTTTLPFTPWDEDGQIALTKAYALNDGCCSVCGCEPREAPHAQHLPQLRPTIGEGTQAVTLQGRVYSLVLWLECLPVMSR